MTITATRAPLAIGDAITAHLGPADVTLTRTDVAAWRVVVLNQRGLLIDPAWGRDFGTEADARVFAREATRAHYAGIPITVTTTVPPLPIQRPAYAAPAKGTATMLTKPGANALLAALNNAGVVHRSRDANIRLLQSLAKRGWLTLDRATATHGKLTAQGRARVQRWLRDTGQTATSRATAVLAA